jgi:hypothetical protein
LDGHGWFVCFVLVGRDLIIEKGENKNSNLLIVSGLQV